MKKLVLIATILFATNTFAAESNIATYQFGKRVAGPGISIFTVTLDSAGNAVVFSNKDKVVGGRRLGQSNLRNLTSMIQSLQQAEIASVYSPIVCKMIVAPENSTDHLYIGNKLVDGPHGCWVSNTVQPKNPYLDNLAHQVKTILKALALEILEG